MYWVRCIWIPELPCVAQLAGDKAAVISRVPIADNRAGKTARANRRPPRGGALASAMSRGTLPPASGRAEGPTARRVVDPMRVLLGVNLESEAETGIVKNDGISLDQVGFRGS